MTIELKIFATLRDLCSPNPNFEITAGENVGTVVDRLKIPRKKITIIFINNVHGSFDSLLRDGDTLGLFPPIGGG